MKYQFEDTRMQTVAVPARVVDGLIGIATAAQLKVLLFLLRYDKLAHDSASIATFCNLKEDEVDAAVDFWIKERVFAKEQGKLRLVSAVKTVQPKELPRVQPTIVLEETDEDFRGLIGEVQRISGKMINSNMVSLLYNMSENLHFSNEMILQLVAYCISIDKFEYRYLETVAIDWYDSGINTFELAEEKIRTLENNRKLELRLARAFGIATAFSAKQREAIAQWNGWGLTEELILEAYNRCMDNKGQMSFAYIGKILEEWNKMGWKKPSDIQDLTKQTTGRVQHEGLSDLEKMAIARMQGDKK
ncbi:MAG: DnaD domain protein [Clostridia bacterium]|nr:DnaD domain protein [Clostridia bacterium]